MIQLDVRFSRNKKNQNFSFSVHGASIFPDHPNPSMRGRMGGMGGVPGKQMPGPGSQPPVRTIDKEWPDKHPRPGMRPTLGGPGIQPNQKQVAGGGMGVIMPIYTVAILVFFIYTIVKIIFKNKKNEEEEMNEDDEFLNSDYYKQYLAQQQKQREVAENVQQKDVPPKQDDIKENDTSEDKIKTTDSNKISKKTAEKKKNVSFDLKESSSGVEESSSNNECQTDEDKIRMNDSNEDVKERDEDVVSTEVSCDEKTNKEELCVTKQEKQNTDTIDPRDLEIKLLKARLEQTEKTLQAVLSQMAGINMPNIKKRSKKKVKEIEE